MGRTRPITLTVVAKDTTPAGVVLVVDDEPSVRRSSVALLQRAGFEVAQAASVEEALALVASHDAPIDAVLSDVVMPHATGIELAADLRSSSPSIEVLLFSGFTPAALGRHQLVDEASPTILQKPLTRAELIEAVTAAVARSRARRAP